MRTDGEISGFHSGAMARACAAFEAGSYGEAHGHVRKALAALDFRKPRHRLLAAEARALLAEAGQAANDAPAARCAAKRAAWGLLRHGGAPALTARMLTVVGITLWDEGSPSRALPYFAKADALLNEDGAQAPVDERVNKRSNLALCHFALWHREESIAAYRSALALAEAHHMHDDARTIRRRLANVHQEDGSYELARQLLDEARPGDGADPVERVGWWNASAMLEERRGQLARAEDQFDRTVAMFPRLGRERHRMTAVLSNTALLKLELGRFDEAARLARRLAGLARAGKGRAPAPLSTRLGALRLQAAIVEGEGGEKRAEAIWRRAQALVETEAGGNAAQRSDIAEQRFRLLWRLGREGDAVDVLLPLVGTVGSSRDGSVIAADRIGPAIRLAQAFLDLGQADRSEPLLRAAFRAEARRSDIEAQWQLLAALADLAAARDRPDAAILLGKIAARIIAEAARPARIDWTARVPYLERRLRPLSRLMERLIAAGRIVEASAVAAQIKRERLSDFVNRSSRPPGGGLSVPMRDREASCEATYRRFCARVATLGAQSADARITPARRRHAKTLLKKAESRPILDELLAFDAGSRVPPPLWPSGDPPLAADHGVARFVETDAGLSVHVMGAGDVVEYATGLSRAAIADRVMRLREAIARQSADEAGLAAELYDILLRPAAGIIGRLRRLDLATMGVLDYLPFACLRDGEGWLIGRLALQVRTAATPGGRTGARAPGRSIVAFATTREVAGLPALRHADIELAGLRAVAPDARIFRDQEFTRERLVGELARRPTHVLLACHFHLEPAASHRSFLVLGDGCEMRLSDLAAIGAGFDGVELVVMSGCDTATVEFTGEGMQSLAGLVLDRGAAAVVGSIWPVDDAQTARLMRRMFAELFAETADGDPAEALRRAQIAAAGAGAQPTAARRGGIGGASRPVTRAASSLSWAGFSVYRPADGGLSRNLSAAQFAETASGASNRSWDRSGGPLGLGG